MKDVVLIPSHNQIVVLLHPLVHEVGGTFNIVASALLSHLQISK